MSMGLARDVGGGLQQSYSFAITSLIVLTWGSASAVPHGNNAKHAASNTNCAFRSFTIARSALVTASESDVIQSPAPRRIVDHCKRSLHVGGDLHLHHLVRIGDAAA